MENIIKKGICALDIERYVKDIKERVDSTLVRILPKASGSVSRAMRYAVQSGGKRLRPVLLITTYQSLGGKIDRKIVTVACSLEFIHAFSLIQDDLPPLDNDDYRRGKPTTHRAFGEDTAILASDALLNEAYKIILDESHFSQKVKLKVLSELSKAVQKLIIGQERDLELEKEKRVSLAQLNEINKEKTGALLRACAKIAGILRNVPDVEIKALEAFGEKLGLAYQILDDVLNVTAEAQAFRGKRFSDRQKGKVTYVSVIGVRKSRRTAQGLMRQAKEEVMKVSHLNTEKLFRLCDFILRRSH